MKISNGMKILLTSFIFLSFFSTAHASLNIDATVDVPASCSVTDTDSVAHNYSATSYLGICALSAAMANNYVTGVQLSNQYPSLGLFITTINAVAANPASQYWAIYQNGSMASTGITTLTIAAGDTIMFQLHDFSDNNLGDQVTLHIHSLIRPATGSLPAPTPGQSGMEALAMQIKPTFDLKNAFQFLSGQQKKDGSFGEDLYTDWTAVALTSGNNQDQVLKLIKYLGNSKINSPLLTDYERRAMTLMALGLNPYDTNGQNYIDKIIGSFDGRQFGDINQDNDDIFALIVLSNAGYSEKDKIINTGINFILGRQKNDGSWDGSPDMTGAAIEALSAFSNNLLVKNALIKAENFLELSQKNNGSWNNNASSTAWAIEGILALGEQPKNWINGGSTPLDYLASIQNTDGGIKSDNLKNEIWQTAYAVSALSGKSWNQLMQKFDKPSSAAVGQKGAGQKKPTEKVTDINNMESLKNNFAVLPTETKPAPTERGWFVKILGYILGF